MQWNGLYHLISICICICSAVTDAKDQRYDITLYNKEILIKLYWKVDYFRNRVDFTLQTYNEAGIRFRFIEGLGMSDRGDVTNADIFLIYCDKDGIVIQDSWSGQDGVIQRDDIQDYHLTEYDVTKNQITIEFWRYINTEDKYDYQLDNGTTNLIYLFDNSDKERYQINDDIFRNMENNDKLDAFSMMHATTSVQLLKPEIPDTYFGEEKDDDISSFNILQPGITLPSQVTTYWCSVHKLPEEITQKVHGIGFTANITNKSRDIVHHLEVYLCDENDKHVSYYNGLCDVEDEPSDVLRCNKVVAAWAKGSGGVWYPKEAGIPLGEIGKSRYIRLEIHYHNPAKVAGLVDNSGITFYYTKKLRQFDAGILEIGLTYTGNIAIPPREKEFILSGQCPQQCTSKGIQDDGINIFASQLHTHLAGRKVWISHYRGNESLHELNRDNHYSTFFEDIRQIYPVVKLMPGDALVTSCSYDTSDRTDVTLGGMGMFDEMCVSYLHYYPLSTLEVCKSSTSPAALFEYFLFEKLFTDKLKSINFDHLSDNFRMMKWDENASDDLKMVYRDSPQDIRCFHHNGSPLQGKWNELLLSNP